MSWRGPSALASIVAALALAAGTDRAAAAAGQLDGGFGGGGAATTPYGPGARAFGIALAPDGRIVVAGDQRGAGGEGALTARFTAAGALDPSFAGSGGRVDRFGTGATPQRAGAVAVQADGATIVAGVAGDTWSLARFLPDGVTDGLFGAAGVTLRDPSPGGAPPEQFHPDELPALPDGTGPASIALATAGQIVVAGSVGVANDDGVPGEQIVVARFGPTGVPDPGFGRDGFVLLQLGFGSAIRHASSAARALSLLTDGRIVIAGRASARDGGDRAFVARLTAAGRLDPDFARQGRLLVQLGHASAARVASSSLEALVPGPGGRLVAAGRATDLAGGTAVLLTRFTGAGGLDAAFGRRGGVVSQLGVAAGRGEPLSLTRGLAVTPDGRVLAVGAATGGILATRFGADGALDCGYGTRGRTLAFGGGGFDPRADGAAAATLQPDGRLLLAGRRARGGLLLARLLDGPAGSQPPASAPRLVTLAARYRGRGRGFAYGLVDGGCGAVAVRFSVTGPDGRTLSTKVRQVSARFGPQVVCAPLTGLRPGGRYEIRIATSPAGAARGAKRVLRAVVSHTLRPQQGCA